MEYRRGPERKIMNGRINKNKMKVYQMRKDQRRLEILKNISKNRYTTVSKELIDRYEETFGVAKQFNELHLRDPESYFKDPESHFRSLKYDRDVRDKSIKSSASLNFRKPLKPTDKDVNNLKSKEKVS